MRRRFQILVLLRRIFYLSLFLLSACESTTASQTQTIHNNTPSYIGIERSSVETDLWRHIANHYALEGYDHPQLRGHIRWFVKNPDYLTRVSKRADDYLYLVVDEVKKAKLPIEIALLPIVESAYYPFSFSHGTASGLWQFIPSTGKLYGLNEDWWYDDRRDVAKSTRAAIKYLKNLTKLFDGDYLLAIAAYNSGPGRVQRAIAKNKRLGKKQDFWHLDLPLETRGYVPRLLAVAQLIKYPDRYGQVLTPVKNQPKLSAVRLDSQLDLALAADWSGLSVDELYTLNPGLKRWATPDIDNYQLLLPIDKVSAFKQHLVQSDPKTRIQWLRHRVLSGQSLISIARQYKTTVESIQSVNDLSSSNIKAGAYLIVPVSRLGDGGYALSEQQREKQRLNAKKTGKKVMHKVRKGESLWSISRQYQTTVASLIKWNQLSDVKALPIGKELVIWQKATAQKPDLKRIVNTGLDINRKVSYRVKSGDNLSSIARKFNTSVDKIAKHNHLDVDQVLKIGQKLNIQVNVLNSNMK